MGNKYLDILPDANTKKVFADVIEKMASAPLGMTRFQINNFVLNDVEFPTPYGKWKQARFELVHRYNQLVDLYYDIRLNDCEIRKQESNASAAKGVDQEIALLEAERLRTKRQGLQVRLENMLAEANAFYAVYIAHPEFQNLTTDQEEALEIADWQEKAKNNPLVFEERYGDEFMRGVLDGSYARYLELRKHTVGALPRELAQQAAIGKDNV